MVDLKRLESLTCREAIWLCAPTCFLALYEPTTAQHGCDGRRHRYSVAGMAKSAERRNNAYLDDDAVLILVKRLLLQVRTELIVPPTDATTQVRPVPQYKRYTLDASTHLSRQLLPLRPGMPSATLDHFFTPCSLMSRRSITSSCIYVHAHNLAVTSNHSELKYDAGLLACALGMCLPLVAKGPTFPSC